MVNHHRQESEKEPLTFSSVYGAMCCMRPIKAIVGKRPQGNTDPNSDWAQARKNWVLQLLIRLGEETYVLLDGQEGPTPAMFDCNACGHLSIHQIAFWDEHHRKIEIGWVKQGRGKDKNFQFLFKRDADGRVSDTGTYRDPKEILHMKYEDEARFSFGSATRVQNDGTVVGLRTKPFYYTGKVILTHPDWQGKVATEIRRVGNLPSGGEWVVNWRLKGQSFLDDSLKELRTSEFKGLGGTTAGKLAEHGLETVAHLQSMSEDKIQEVARAVCGVSLQTLQLWCHKAQNATEIKPDNLVVDYRTFDNPYEACYGVDCEAKLRNCVFLKNFCSVRELVTHIYEETKRQFQDTIYKDSFYFYHDALSLMTATSTMDWMRETGILKHWLLPNWK